MSVYTTVERDALAEWLAPLSVGPLIDYSAIAAGIQNSNYFVSTAKGRWVLTLFEHIEAQDLAFYLGLQAHLSARGIPCPNPVAAGGNYWRPLAGKPAALFNCLPGKSLSQATPEHCHHLGGVLARIHLAGADYPDPPPNPCGAEWRARTGQRLAPRLSPDERTALMAELAFQSAQDFSQLPRGIVHADLFRDNTLWANDQLTGVLDFYFAGEDALLFDLAVVANDWCNDAPSLQALIAGYQQARPLTLHERAAWPAMRRAAALRFWLLRLEAREHPRTGSVVTIKDPNEFGTLLQHLRLVGDVLPG